MVGFVRLRDFRLGICRAPLVRCDLEGRPCSRGWRLRWNEFNSMGPTSLARVARRSFLFRTSRRNPCTIPGPFLRTFWFLSFASLSGEVIRMVSAYEDSLCKVYRKDGVSFL